MESCLRRLSFATKSICHRQEIVWIMIEIMMAKDGSIQQAGLRQVSSLPTFSKLTSLEQE